MDQRRWRLGHDVALPALIVLLTIVDLAVSGHGKEPTAAAAALALVSAASVVGVRRQPLAVLAFSGAIGLALAVLGYRLPSTVAAPAVALYCVARDGGRTRTIVVGAVAAVAAETAEPLLTGVSPLRLHTLLHVGLVAIPLLLGSLVRVRHGYIELLLERLALAEHTREETARRRVEEERLRIARDLHDVVAHTLTGINVQAGVAAHLVGREPERANEALRMIKERSSEALDELRGIVGVLRTADGAASFEPAPSLDDIPELVEDACRHGLGVELTIRGESRTVPEAVQLAAYRIVQESLTNARRHAGSVAANVDVEIGPERLHLSVRNPIGPGPEAGDGAGVGIVGMRERAAAVGGSLTAAPFGDAFEVAADLPFRRRG